MVRSSNDLIIRELLKTRPGHLFILPDGSALYVLVDDEWETVLEFKGPDFSVMTDADVNDYIIETLNNYKLSE
jgi:hypothetical protein